MANEHLQHFIREPRRAEVGPTLTGRGFEYAPELVACASLLPASLEQYRRAERSNFEMFVPLVERLSLFYRIPPPAVGPLLPDEVNRGLGCYDPLLHQIRLSPSLPPAVLIRILFHECHHAYQASLVAAAAVRDVKDGKSVPTALDKFPPSILEDVYAQRKHEDPVLVAIGRILGESNEKVAEARRYGAETLDADEYLSMQRVYRNSFEELCSKVVELEVAVWQAEEELYAAEDRCEKWAQKLHEMGWFGEAVSSLLSEYLARRCYRWRAQIKELSTELTGVCNQIHRHLVYGEVPGVTRSDAPPG